jgi:sugar phosphate isomerase/epimerase
MTGRPDRIEWGFSSLGAPQLAMKALGALAHEFKLEFLELRAVKGTIALPDYFRENPAELGATDVPIRVLSTSLRLTTASDADLAEFVQYVELAKKFKAPYVRVFGGEEWGTEITPELLSRAAGTIAQCRKRMQEQDASCEMILETHSGFSSGRTCRLLNEQLQHPLPILWDSHHTWKLAKEPLEQSWRELGQWVRHIHIKDSVLDPGSKSGYQYVPPGQGRFPTRELLDLLARAGYRGGISLEWEKFWRPELPEISEALKGLKQVSVRVA